MLHFKKAGEVPDVEFVKSQWTENEIKAGFQGIEIAEMNNTK